MFRSATVRSIALLALIPGSLAIAAPSAMATDIPAAVNTPAETPASTPIVETASIVTPAQKMLRLTLFSPETRDMRGVEPSMYRGRYFRASVEPKRRCIAERESEGHYDVVSRSGYHGAYQMSPQLARGATWMMMREHRGLLGAETATKVLSKLRSTPLSRWPRYWQDAAFSTIYNWKATGSGAAHWRGGRWHC